MGEEHKIYSVTHLCVQVSSSLLRRGLFHFRAGEWGEVKTRRAEARESGSKSARGTLYSLFSSSQRSSDFHFSCFSCFTPCPQNACRTHVQVFILLHEYYVYRHKFVSFLYMLSAMINRLINSYLTLFVFLFSLSTMWQLGVCYYLKKCSLGNEPLSQCSRLPAFSDKNEGRLLMHAFISSLL